MESIPYIVRVAAPAVAAFYAFRKGGAYRLAAFGYLAFVGSRYMNASKVYPMDRAAKIALDPARWDEGDF